VAETRLEPEFRRTRRPPVSTSTACSLARKRARNGYAETIVLNKGETSREGPGENVFLRDGELYTPVSRSILDGITRDSVIRIAEDLGYTVHDNVSRFRAANSTDDEAVFTAPRPK